MGKSRTGSRGNQDEQRGAEVKVQLPLPMIGMLEDVRQGFLALCIETGRQVLGALMEKDRRELCGAPWSRKQGRRAGRGGSTQSWITLGGRQIALRRLRARSCEGTEIELPSFRWAAVRDPLDDHTLGAVAAGVSSRRYRGTLDQLPAQERERLTSKSAVSRRFVELSQRMIKRWLAQPLDQIDVRVIKIDGIMFRGRCVLIALGITAAGLKRVLGAHQGTTENAAVAKTLLTQLIDRGLPTDRALLFVIDGSKALHKAIRDVFGDLALIQRCQVHKRRNVREHLPDAMQVRVARVIEQAYGLKDASAAERMLENLARSLEYDQPGAAASLREGLQETLTLQRLGISGALYRTLRSTNTIENLNGTVAQFTRNVRRWRGGAMLQRWTAAALQQAEKGFRRIKGYNDLHLLIAALQRRESELQLDTKRKVA